MRGTWLVVAVALCACGGPSSSTDIDAPHGDDAAVVPDAFVPDAPPSTYQVGGRVENLIGTGLVIELDGGATLSFAQDGTFTFPEARVSGTPYSVTITAAPTNPAQSCTITNASGVIGNADVADVTVTCALGGLRINEVSSCFYVDVPCWFEVVNVGTVAEELSTYRLRASATDRVFGGMAAVPQEFQLPALVLQPGGYAIVRGLALDGLLDGRNVVHILDAVTNRVPYWRGEGFVELTRSGKTVDFVRMGISTEAPSTIGWSGPGAPAIASTIEYGVAIARDATSTDTDVAGDWTKRVFATPGGPNDITSNADADNDGIPDQAEVPGGTFAGLDLYARGVRTGQRDVLLEIDYMQSADPVITPRRGALDKLVASFAPHGIVVHADVGSLLSATPGAADYNFGGGNPLPFLPVIGLGLGSTGIYALKVQHMDVRLQAVSHYVVFGNKLDVGALGIGELGGNDVIVAMADWGFTVNSPADILFTENTQAGTVMHELGHNFGLLHGGDENKSYKPNHLSVMNYMYSFRGIPTIGDPAEGDRFYALLWPQCSFIASDWELHNNQGTTTFVLDFSSGAGSPLNEAGLVEAAGLGRTGSAPVDYNCDGAIGTVAVDVDNSGTATDIHTDHDDWGSLRLAFSRTDLGSTFVAQPRPSQFTHERRPAADETGFRPVQQP